MGKGMEETSLWLYATAEDFVLPVNLDVSQSWLLLEWESSNESALSLFKSLSPFKIKFNCLGHVSTAVSFRASPHCCQMLDCYGLPYFLPLLLPQNLRRRFHSEVARLSPAPTRAAASCSGSWSGTGMSFSEAATGVCSQWQLPVKVKAKGGFKRTWTAIYSSSRVQTWGKQWRPRSPTCPANPCPLNSLLLTTFHTSSTRELWPVPPESLQDLSREHHRLPIFF